jgi:peptide chain release factor 2
MKQKLFSLTEKDFKFNAYCGSGAGGQKKNKTASAMRCFHEPSKSEGKCEDHREQHRNKKEAFLRCTQTKTFKDWLSLEIKRRSGELAIIEAEVEASMRKVKVEVKDENGRWVDEER